jgi:hypothetical protein
LCEECAGGGVGNIRLVGGDIIGTLIWGNISAKERGRFVRYLWCYGSCFQ